MQYHVLLQLLLSCTILRLSCALVPVRIFCLVYNSVISALLSSIVIYEKENWTNILPGGLL